MRSALWKASEILGEDADPQQLYVLWSVICDLIWKRFPKVQDTPAYKAATGPERVRMVIAAAIDGSYIADGTEPEAMLLRLGLGHLARQGRPADD